MYCFPKPCIRTELKYAVKLLFKCQTSYKPATQLINWVFDDILTSVISSETWNWIGYKTIFHIQRIRTKKSTERSRRLISFNNFSIWFLLTYISHQGPRSLRKCAGAKGGTIFLGDFLLHFCAIWKNDPFSKSENVLGLKPRLPRWLRGPWEEVSILADFLLNKKRVAQLWISAKL